MTDLRDTLLVLATVQDSPGDPAGVLALAEERLGLAVLEAEDLGVPADKDLTLQHRKKTILAKAEFVIFHFLVRSGKKAIVRNHFER